MTSEKWKRWSTLPDPHVAYFNWQTTEIISRKHWNIRTVFVNGMWKSTMLWVQSSCFISFLQQSTWSNSVTIVNWNQCLQICTRSAHGYHTTAVHLVLIRQIFNGHIYILKRYTYCIILHYKMYKSCRKQWNDSLVHVHMNL